MEFSICIWQNYKKIGPILAIKSKEFNYQNVTKNLINDLPAIKKTLRSPA